jgi:regulation of enolase protein 1 (concanavalin A-like superfamily)
MDKANVLTISAEAKTDWFVDPFDGTVARNAPILLFTPDSDYVFGARVTLKFITKWDAGALMLWGDDHHWAKLSFELSPGKKSTLVTVVTRGLSDDCNSSEVQGDSVYLRLAKSGNTDTIGKFFALLAWIQSFPSASVLRRSLRQAQVPS